MKKSGKIRRFFSVLFIDLKHIGKQLWEPLHRTAKRTWKFVSKLAKKKIFLKNVKVGGQTGDGRNKKKNR
jgi:hypothetical protein